MIRQSTIDKLHDMRLSAMSDAFECQCKDPDTSQGLSFEDRFGMLVDKEWDKRKSTKLQKLIRSAEFRYPNACMEDIEYHPDRNLDKGQMLEFSTCRYISDDHHIILKGASGNGKTYIAFKICPDRKVADFQHVFNYMKNLIFMKVLGSMTRK